MVMVTVMVQSVCLGAGWVVLMLMRLYVIVGTASEGMVDEAPISRPVSNGL